MIRKFSFMLFLITMVIGFNLLNAEKVTILHINDSHSNLTPGGERNEDLKANIGGIAKFATIANNTRQVDTSAILLHAGDFSIGDIMYCNFIGVLELGLLTQLGFNAVTLGNHEFDLGPDILEIVLNSGLAGTETKALCSNGNFNDVPILKSLIQDTLTIMANGVKVGIFGVTTPNTTQLSNPSPVTFDDNELLIANINNDIVKLKSAGCKIIIMLSHLGFWTDYAISANLTDVNAIIGGHDHFLVDMDVELADGKTCKIVQAGSYYQWTGKLVFDVTDEIVTIDDFSLIPLDDSIEDDETMTLILNDMIKEIESTFGPVYSEKVVTVEETFSEIASDLHKLGNHDTDVGNLDADIYKEFGKTDIGITASGFTAHELFKGSPVGADIYRINGYGYNEDNTLGFKVVTFDIKGEDIVKGIAFGMNYIRYTDDYLIQCSNNMSYEYTFIPQTEDSLFGVGSIERIKINGSPIVNDKYYSVTTHEGILSFLLYSLQLPIENLIYADNNFTEYLVLMDYLKTQNSIKPVQKGRIKCIESTSVPYKVSAMLDGKAYPNPCGISVTLEFEVESSDFYQVMIVDNQGKLIFEATHEFYEQGINNTSLDTKEFINGTYHFLVSNGKTRHYGKFIVHR